ncbi:adenylate/guanylate cyclase domain-containing protein [Alphaproteobacteria bacterium]|nr:adenylate/guanylate cyclase domain-containing protein [Alphaproteobacteria bacterium]
MENTKRKLATILATDCVSFSKYMEENEELTLSNLNSCRVIIDDIIKEMGGRIFHTAGDSVISEFSSPVECINAAVMFQKALYERNNLDETTLKLQWRVGIHVDDVIIEGDNIYGSGVNVAARLESQCEPGQILISRIVQEQVNKRISFTVEDAGTKKLKNISDEFSVFSVSPMGDYKPDQSTKSHNETAKVNNVNNILTKSKPKLAILPFTNSNNDEDSEYLVDGIVEDLITEFSMIKEFEIVSRQTSLNFKKSDEDASEFAKTHSVDFLISGGIRSSGKRVRISIELSETAESKILWSNKYDRVLEDIFDVQDEIVRTISISLLGELEISSLQRSKRKPTENMSSYEFLLRGKEQHHKTEKEANALALDFFDKAIEADKLNAQAHAWKTCTLGQGLFNGFIKGEFADIWSKAEFHLQKAQELNENDQEVHRLMTSIHLSKHEYKEAVEHGEKAYNMNPNDPRILSGYGEVLVRTGSPEEGINHLLKALELDPIPQGQSNSDNRFKDLVLGYFFSQDYEKCEEYGSKIKKHDFKSWILFSYAQQNNNNLSKEDENYLNNYKSFLTDNWEADIDRFHIQNVEIKNNLVEFVSSII